MASSRPSPTGWRIFDAIRKDPYLPPSQIVADTSLDLATVMSTIQSLLELRLVNQSSPSTFAINPKAGYFVGIELTYDFSYTIADQEYYRFRARLLPIDLAFRPYDPIDTFADLTLPLRYVTSSRDQVDAIVEAGGFVDDFHNFFDQIHRLLPKPILGIGFSWPGIIRPDSGSIYFTPHTARLSRPIVANELIPQDCWSDLGEPIVVADNDACCAVLAEKLLGGPGNAPRPEADIVAVILANGVGAGLLLNNEVYHGSRGASGEIGHIAVNESRTEGEECSCGCVGCLEYEISTTAIARKRKTALVARNFDAEHITNAGLSDIARAAGEGDIAARHLLNEIGFWLGKALAISANIINPELIVLTGAPLNSYEVSYQ